MSTLNWKVKLDRVFKVRREVDDLVEQAVERSARNIQAGAMARAPVRTGNLRASILAEESGKREWTVAVGAEYGAYVNYGTRNTSPNPFFTQAVEAEMPRFVASLHAIEARVK